MYFKRQIENIKQINFPDDQFAVVSSGSLAVRGIREANDIDIIVTPTLWKDLIKRYQVNINESGVETIALENDIEILNPSQSIFGNSKVIPLSEIIESADVFNGVKFINLDHLKAMKNELGREKDLRDIALIENYQKNSI